MIKPGTLLIAPPHVQHRMWGSATILISNVTNTEVTGILLNKQSQMSLSELGNRLNYDLDHLPGVLHLGGTDRQTSFSILHSSEWSSTNTFRVNEHLSVSSDNDVLKRFEDGDEPEYWRMFLGMCTWTPLQLENELSGLGSPKTNINWCTSSCDSDLIFDTDIEDMWEEALERCSLEFAKNFML